MYSRFYQNAKLAFAVNPRRFWNLFELDEGRIVVCAFNSCGADDCYGHVGEIPLEDIARSHLELLSSEYRLKIAVWHHDVQGPPKRSDYMDYDTVRLMIDKGYRLGIHGHQHKSDASPCSTYSFEKHTMAVVCAGSLCAASPDLPTGVFRQYNIVEIRDDCLSARVHVREMTLPGVFSAGRLVALGNRSFVDMDWTPAPAHQIVNTGVGGGMAVARIERVEQLLALKQYDEAVALLESSNSSRSTYANRLRIEALFGGRKWDRIVELLADPKSPDELAKLVRALVELRKWPEAKEVLRVARSSNRFPPIVLRELLNWLEGEMVTHK